MTVYKNFTIHDLKHSTNAWAYSDYPPHSCGTCAFRSYGDQRSISQCSLKIYGGDPGPAPRARDFGTKCKRFKVSIAAHEALNGGAGNLGGRSDTAIAETNLPQHKPKDQGQ